jgi:hypothetical protein
MTKDVPRPEEQVVNDGQVAGPDVTGVILKEGGPALARTSQHLGHVHQNRPLADSNTEHQQLAADALGTPQPVFPGHLPDEGNGPWGGTRLSVFVPRFASPIAAKEIAMPTQQGVRLVDGEGLLPGLGAAGEDDQSNAFDVG